jgi:hypothetical protein
MSGKTVARYKVLIDGFVINLYMDRNTCYGFTMRLEKCNCLQRLELVMVMGLGLGKMYILASDTSGRR